ncbi:hypothetical protein Asulf_00271 [Archaeoglobus sulfaticallidus PM70-1]|uniref:SAM-dependent MTase TRM10-type domain-containing protein n=1 Tax=Archaeoglobus sulfaticallidus PM70-1 TaxID=387631 RepID=N0B9M7_9EURY|nr:hypothetical protein [Archaeoglobus sulfaticallidus]AGK60304.1 hypothetical protein Asulf_00271 [Archaeoglobus sulfaticallidus PM70-1]
MRLKDYFIELLKEHGIDSISTSLKLISRDPIQQMAVYVANGKANVCRGSEGKAFKLNGEPVSEAKAFVGDCSNAVFGRDELIERTEGFPYVVIDCQFYDLHSKKEKSKVKTQLRATLGVIRDFMWDDRLAITGKKIQEFERFYSESTASFIKEKNFDRVILLDPNAEEVYSGEKADCFIIGGIVDKTGNKKGWTSKIGRDLEREGIDFTSAKILLRGDTIGVPDRINTIAEMVLLTVLDGIEVEEAIRRVQSNLVARWRLKKELPKITKRLDSKRPFRFVLKSDFRKFDWLNLSYRDFLEVCRQMDYIVVDDSLFEIIQKFEFDEVKGAYKA